MPNPLPPLNAIRVFDAAARHLSFVRASEELGVTQSAVSKQIAILEDFIGGQLFERIPGGVSLTLEGRELRNAISPAFSMINKSFERYSRRAPRSNKFRLATVASFASQFLVPRLDDFERVFPASELEILTSDRVLDLNREEIDISIRYGAGEWENVIAHPLLDGKLIPVCAPQLWETADGDIAKLILTSRRIQAFSTNEWEIWAASSGISIEQSNSTFTMEHFLVALQAAISRQGVALLPEIIVRQHLAKGQLIQFSGAIDWPQTFFIVHLLRAEKRPMTREVIAWLRKQVRPTSKP